MTIEMIFEIVVGVLSVIGLLWAGVFIGREFGTFEKFIIWHLERLAGKDTHLPPYEDE